MMARYRRPWIKLHWYVPSTVSSVSAPLTVGVAVPAVAVDVGITLTGTASCAVLARASSVIVSIDSLGQLDDSGGRTGHGGPGGRIGHLRHAVGAPALAVRQRADEGMEDGRARRGARLLHGDHRIRRGARHRPVR